MMKIVEVGTVHERIDKLIYHFSKGNRTSFGRETDILPGVLASIVGGRLSKPSFEVLQKILTGYPLVSADWLLFGRGPMLRDESVELVDTEGVSFTAEEAKRLLDLQESNAVENKKAVTEMERLQADMSVVLSVMQAFNNETIVPDKARQIMKENPTLFPPTK